MDNWFFWFWKGVIPTSVGTQPFWVMFTSWLSDSQHSSRQCELKFDDPLEANPGSPSNNSFRFEDVLANFCCWKPSILARFCQVVLGPMPGCMTWPRSSPRLRLHARSRKCCAVQAPGRDMLHSLATTGHSCEWTTHEIHTWKGKKDLKISQNKIGKELSSRLPSYFFSTLEPPTCSSDSCGCCSSADSMGGSGGTGACACWGSKSGSSTWDSSDLDKRSPGEASRAPGVIQPKNKRNDQKVLKVDVAVQSCDSLTPNCDSLTPNTNLKKLWKWNGRSAETEFPSEQCYPSVVPWYSLLDIGFYMMECYNPKHWIAKPYTVQ